MRGFKNRNKKSVRTKNDDIKTIQKKLTRDATQINEMLKRLRRADFRDEYAYNNIIKRLTTEKLKVANQNIIKTKKIKNEKSIMKLRAISQVFRKFKMSKTSTVKGVIESHENFKKGLENLFGYDLNSITLDKFRKLMENEDIQNLKKDVGGSELFIILDKSIDKAKATMIDLADKSVTKQKKAGIKAIKNYLKMYTSISDKELKDIANEVFKEFFSEED